MRRGREVEPESEPKLAQRTFTYGTTLTRACYHVIHTQCIGPVLLHCPEYKLNVSNRSLIFHGSIMGALKQSNFRPSWSLDFFGSFGKPLVAALVSPVPWFNAGSVKVFLCLRNAVATFPVQSAVLKHGLGPQAVSGRSPRVISSNRRRCWGGMAIAILAAPERREALISKPDAARRCRVW